MGQRHPPEGQRPCGFLDHYRIWFAFHDYVLPYVEGESITERDRRGELMAEPFRQAEAALLSWQPTSCPEMIGMLEVIAQNEELRSHELDAITAIQANLTIMAAASLRDTVLERHKALPPKALTCGADGL